VFTLSLVDFFVPLIFSLSCASGLFFMSTKRSVFDALLASGFRPAFSPPRITINRIKAMKLFEKDNKNGSPTNHGQDSVFGQIFTALRYFFLLLLDPSPLSSLFFLLYLLYFLSSLFFFFSSFRAEYFQAGKRDMQMWNVSFQGLFPVFCLETLLILIIFPFDRFSGEGSIDVGGYFVFLFRDSPDLLIIFPFDRISGGPYRESLTNMCADLMSSATPLFIKCPNGRGSVGLNREKFIPNPSSDSSLYLAMFEFVGALMVCLRFVSVLIFSYFNFVFFLLFFVLFCSGYCSAHQGSVGS
jgi:hypothetical protein